MESKATNRPVPAWLIAAVMAAGMTAYADECDRPAPRAKAPPASVAPDEDPNVSAGPLPPEN